MTDPVSGSQTAGSTAATQLSVAGTKTALDAQKQEGEAALKLLETAVSSGGQDSPGQQLDVTA